MSTETASSHGDRRRSRDWQLAGLFAMLVVVGWYSSGFIEGWRHRLEPCSAYSNLGSDCREVECRERWRWPFASEECREVRLLDRGATPWGSVPPPGEG